MLTVAAQSIVALLHKGGTCTCNLRKIMLRNFIIHSQHRCSWLYKYSYRGLQTKTFKLFLLYSFLQCCGSGMFIPDPGSWFLPIPDPGSRIPDPKTATKMRGGNRFVVKPFFVAKNFTKLKLFYFLNAEEKNLGWFSKNYRTFYPKICH